MSINSIWINIYTASADMSRRRKKKRTKTNPIKVFGYLLCFAITAFGCLMAANMSKNHDFNIFRNDSSSDSGIPKASNAKHYPALETVTLPDSLPSQVKEYIGFTISFNKLNKTPNYVAWELLDKETSGDKKRSNKFWTDSDIEGCPYTSDYTRAGYDRGHMCPSADQKWSPQAMEDCFVMANICPQTHALNNGAWKTLENKERQWAKRDSAIMIIAGPIYNESDTSRIGYSSVRVPGAFFKVLLSPYTDQPKAIAFVYPNMTAPGNMQNYAMSVDELEKMTGYDFFPALPDEIEKEVESSFSFKEWNKSTK